MANIPLNDRDDGIAQELADRQAIIKQDNTNSLDGILHSNAKGRQSEGGLRVKGYSKEFYHDQPLITVITVVFNAKEQLEKTIESVIGQDYGNIEYIIIDGGSTDGTLDIIKKYDHVIDYWVSEKDEGIYDAMNKAVSVSTGDYINFMNAGDLFFEINTIKKVAPFLIAELVYGNHAVYFDDSNKINIVDVGNQIKKKDIPFCHQSLFEKRILLQKYPFNLDYKISSDYDHYLTCKHKNVTIQYIPLVISKFLDGGLSSKQIKKLLEENYHASKKYYKFYSKYVYFKRLLKFHLFGKQ